MTAPKRDQVDAAVRVVASAFESLRPATDVSGWDAPTRGAIVDALRVLTDITSGGPSPEAIKPLAILGMYAAAFLADTVVTTH